MTPHVAWRNPFLDEYIEEELAFYALPPGLHRVGGVEALAIEPTRKQMDDYFNHNPRVRPLPALPALFIKRQVWMSLTPLELQSLAVPIALAHGRVATAGLGLGYFALRAAAKAEVSEVVVYEQNGDVIALFNLLFGTRPERAKITIIQGDVREKLRGRHFDMVFMDPYPTLLGDEVVEDAHLFRAHNTIGLYTFWGLERVLLDALMAGEIPQLLPAEAALLRSWATTPLDPQQPEGPALRDHYYLLAEPPFRARVLAALAREKERANSAPPTPSAPRA